MNPKVIIFDIDSTLTESKQPLSQEMAEALKKLLDKMPVGIMSGADFPQFEKQLLAHLPQGVALGNLFLFPTSAAECLSFKDGKWQAEYDYLFTKEEKEKIIKALEAVAPKEKEIFGEQIEDRGEQITWSALGQEAPLGIKEKWDPDHAKRQKIKEKLEKLIPEFEINIGGSTSIDITRKGISKEDGILWLEKHFGVPASEMLYVGDALFDGGNDAEVKKTSVQTKQVSGPAETIAFLQGLPL